MSALSGHCRPALLLALPLVVAGACARAECPGSGQLDEALRLVAVANPVLVAAGAVVRESRKSRDWTAVLTIGYDSNETYETGAAGARAAVNVQIPLFDNQARVAKAKEHAAFTAQQDATATAFIGDIQTLCELASQRAGFETMRSLTRDRLEYRQERVNQGLDPADRLWQEAEALQSHEHQLRAAESKLDALRLTLARRYGGEEWPRLQALLTAMTN
jgi:hypothetical protein